MARRSARTGWPSATTAGASRSRPRWISGQLRHGTGVPLQPPAAEIWQDGKPVLIDAWTDDDGEDNITVRANGHGLRRVNDQVEQLER